MNTRSMVPVPSTSIPNLTTCHKRNRVCFQRLADIDRFRFAVKSALIYDGVPHYFPRELPTMASVTKVAKGYRAQVYVKGTRESQCFRTKREAETWAAAKEVALREAAAKPPGEQFTLLQALRKYGEEISPKKRGVRWELIRLKSFESHPDLPINKMIGEIGSDDLALWRDARSKVVGAGSVRRDFSLLADVLEIARREWKWISVNPARDVKRPPSPAHREVIISAGQIRRMLRTMNYTSHGQCRSATQAVAVCFLVALRTGMRAGELTGLTWDRVCGNFCKLPITKTKAREVPFSAKVRRLIERMRGFDDLLVFGLKSQSLDALFRKYRERAGLSGFTFHDSRHTAATWIGKSGKLELLEFCRMFGWSNPRMAMVYFNATASDIAKRFDDL